ncbi:hypothetical protein ABJI51_14700 [Amycolatopsis sp. NEAU-NG30]|uniref:Uncharacterized protein n=1 Tax=Amycolatopsis melonis TaxID=3156488 RepID=A0ABV0LDI3_9PSEU
MPDDDDWVLVRHVPASADINIGVELTAIRQIPPDERREISSKAHLVNKYFASWTWAKIVESVNSFIQVVHDAADVANKSSSVINDADVHKANLSFRESGRLIETWLDECRGIAKSNNNEELGTAIGQVVSGDGPYAAFRNVYNSVQEDLIKFEIKSLMPFAFTATLSYEASRVAGVPGDLDAVSFMRAVMANLEPVAEGELLSQKAHFLECCRHFRQLSLDCLYGVPVLTTNEDLSRAITGGTLSLEQLPFVGAELVVANVSKAEKKRKIRLGHSQMRGNPAKKVNASVENGARVTPPSVDSLGRPEAQVAAENPSAEFRFDALSPPIDLRLLTDEIKTLPEDIERRWSQSLGAVLAEDNDRLHRRLQSYVAATGSALADRAQRFDEKYGTSQGRPFPISAELLAQILSDDKGQVFDARSLIAQIYALTYLKNTLGYFTAPGVSSFRPEDGRVDSWWSSGAFDSARKIVESMSVLAMQFEWAGEEASLESREIDPRSTVWQHYAQIGLQEALSGSVENSVINCSRAATLWLQQADGVQVGENPGLVELRESLRESVGMLRDLAIDVISGRHVSIFKLWCAAGFWNNLLTEWVSEEMRSLRSAVERRVQTGGAEASQ